MSIIAVPKCNSSTLQCNINLQLQFPITSFFPRCHKLTWRRKAGRAGLWAKRVTHPISLNRFSEGILKILQSSGHDQDCPMALVCVSVCPCLRSSSAKWVYQTIIDTRISRPYSAWQSLLPLPSSCATACCFGITQLCCASKGSSMAFSSHSWPYLELHRPKSVFQVAFGQGFFGLYTSVNYWLFHKFPSVSWTLTCIS